MSVLIISFSIELVKIIYYFLGFSKTGYGTVWRWFCFFLPMFFSEIQETLLRSKKNYLIAAFVGRSHTDYFHEDKTIFVCCFYHLLNGMRFDIPECLHGFFKCVMMLACIRPKMFLMLQKNYKEPFKILYEIYLLNMKLIS